MAKHSDIMKQVFAHMWGLVVVDHQSRIVFIEEKYARSRGLDPEALVGCDIKEIVPTSKLPQVVETGRPIWGDVFYHQGKPLICNRLPLVKDGSVIGAMSYQVFEVAEKLFESIKELQSQLDYYKEKVKKYSGARYGLNDIVGSSTAAKEIRAAILHAAASAKSTVVIQGETGTGKELVAHSLHQESRRAHYPFVKLNCAGMAQDLIGSEVFG